MSPKPKGYEHLCSKSVPRRNDEGKKITYVFQEWQKGKRPYDCAQSPDNVFFRRHRPRGRPYPIENIEGGGSDVGINDTYRYQKIHSVMRRMSLKPSEEDLPRVWKLSERRARPPTFRAVRVWVAG